MIDIFLGELIYPQRNGPASEREDAQIDQESSANDQGPPHQSELIRSTVAYPVYHRNIPYEERSAVSQVRNRGFSTQSLHIQNAYPRHQIIALRPVFYQHQQNPVHYDQPMLMSVPCQQFTQQRVQFLCPGQPFSQQTAQFYRQQYRQQQIRPRMFPAGAFLNNNYIVLPRQAR